MTSGRVAAPARAHGRLSRERIVDAAIALIEADGADALSMRRLGAALEVEAMSLYHHFAKREELLVAIGARALQPLNDLRLAGGWRDACREFATALRDIGTARPATFRMVGLEPLDTPLSLRAVERLLAVLVEHGFSARDGLATYRAVASYARGYALAEATGFTVDAAAAAGRRHLDALPREDFPILGGRAHELAALDADSGFERGLRALLDGLPEPG